MPRRASHDAKAPADHLYRFVTLERRDRIALRNRVDQASEQFDWKLLGKHYDEAHAMALQRLT